MPSWKALLLFEACEAVNISCIAPDLHAIGMPEP